MRYILFGHPQAPGSIKRHVVETHVIFGDKALVLETKLSDFETKVRAVNYNSIKMIKNYLDDKLLALEHRPKVKQIVSVAIPYSDDGLGTHVFNLIKERMV